MPNEYMLRGITGQRAAVKPLEGIIEGYPIVFNQRTAITFLRKLIRTPLTRRICPTSSF